LRNSTSASRSLGLKDELQRELQQELQQQLVTHIPNVLHSHGLKDELQRELQQELLVHIPKALVEHPPFKLLLHKLNEQVHQLCYAHE